MAPPPSCRIASAAAREQIQVPLRSTAITSSHWRSAGHVRASPVRMSAPALLTQSVEPPERLERRLRAAGRPRPARETSARIGEGLAAGRQDLGHHGLGALARARVVDDDAGALPREGEGDRAADPPARAGDDGHLAREALPAGCARLSRDPPDYYNAAPMRLLVSVVDAGEARVAAAAGADVIDVKDPSRGALGEAAPAVVRAVRDATPAHLPGERRARRRAVHPRDGRGPGRGVGGERRRLREARAPRDLARGGGREPPGRPGPPPRFGSARRGRIRRLRARGSAGSPGAAGAGR